jgi:hypothetical protein
MARKDPVCPYGHPKGHRPLPVVLKISNHVLDRQLGGYTMTAKVLPGVDVHCPECHLEGWIGVSADWNLDSWDGPRTCACGLRSELFD